VTQEKTFLQPVALGSEVSGVKPTACSYNNESIVLFRDDRGIVKALENRCCHRRVPLSLGEVRSEGWLQCGYHGWSFDGDTGQCKAIPNLPDEKNVPRAYGVYAYQVEEKHGLIYVGSKSHTAQVAEHSLNLLNCSASGKVMVGLSPQDYIAAILDEPSQLLKSRGVRFTDTLVSDPIKHGEFWQTERAANWLGRSNFGAFVREYALLLRSDIHLPSGQLWLSIRRPDDQIVCALQLAISPARRGVSSVLWRALKGEATGLMPVALRSFFAAMLLPRKTLNYAALVDLLEGPSNSLPRYNSAELYGELLETRGNTQWQSVQ